MSSGAIALHRASRFCYRIPSGLCYRIPSDVLSHSIGLLACAIAFHLGARPDGGPVFGGRSFMAAVERLASAGGSLGSSPNFRREAPSGVGACAKADQVRWTVAIERARWPEVMSKRTSSTGAMASPAGCTGRSARGGWLGARGGFSTFHRSADSALIELPVLGRLTTSFA